MFSENTNQDNFGILDAVSLQEKASALRTLQAQSAIFDYLKKLSDREQQILEKRYGLRDGTNLTLEHIGEELSLTRERVRQIEKEALKKLRKFDPPLSFTQSREVVYRVLEDHGNLCKEEIVLAEVLGANATAINRQAILFLLLIDSVFEKLDDSPEYQASWYIAGFNLQKLYELKEIAQNILKQNTQPELAEVFFKKVNKELLSQSQDALPDNTIESYASIIKAIDKNPFGEWGLASWSKISPKDVGDKAYLVLAHHKHPEHYKRITELINKNSFDKKTANKETVHNELIKDRRFVLIGRGIYALAEWGFKPGVVADVIAEILVEAGRPLNREEIVTAVLKRRQVKRNTVIVGLSNRKRFARKTDGTYTNA